MRDGAISMRVGYRFGWIRRLRLVALLALASIACGSSAQAGQSAPDRVRAEETRETLAELMAHARSGDAEEQNRLGLLLLAGKYVVRNPAEGVRWIRSAAEQGLVVAQYELGAIYGRGADAPKDLAEAAKWFRAAADQGYAPAQQQLGLLYEQGQGVTQNFDEALTWLHRAADQGDDAARFELAQMVEKGEGTTKDMSQAVALLQAAAIDGFAPGQIVIAAHYLSGVGVGRDPVYAYFWSTVGAAHAPDNFTTYAASVRDKATQLLGPDKVAELQSVAAEWRPGADPAPLLGSPAPAEPIATGPTNGAPIRGMSGTGFVVASDGYVITNAHVVPGCSSITVRISGSASYAATVVDRDPRIDLALLRAETTFSDVASFRDGPGIAQGDDIVAFGFPLAGLLSDQGNLTTGTVSALSGINNDAQLIQISAPIQHGNSGGPVIDSSGNVVGVIVSKIDHAQGPDDVAQNVNFAIGEEAARRFLASNGLTYQSSQSIDLLKRADLVARIKAVTVQIVCAR